MNNFIDALFNTQLTGDKKREYQLVSGLSRQNTDPYANSKNLALSAARSALDKKQSAQKAGLDFWYQGLMKPTPKIDTAHIDYPTSKYNLPQSITQQIQSALDNFNTKQPKAANFIGNSIRGTNEMLGKINDFLTNKDTPIGWAGGLPKRIGEQAADQFIGGFNQLKTQTPSKVPFTNWEVPANIAGPAKMGMSVFNLTPAMQLPNIAMDATQTLADKTFGKDSLPSLGLTMAAGFAVPGGESKDLKNAEAFASKLESALATTKKLTPLQEAFRALPKKEKLGYLVGKMSKEDLKLSAPALWKKIEGIEIESEKTKNAFSGIFAKFIGLRDAAKTRGVQEAVSATLPEGIDASMVINRLEGIGKSTPEVDKVVGQLRGKFNTLHTEAKNAGVPLGYIDDYVTHIWKESPDEVAAKYKSLGKFKFGGERKIATYQEGIEAGLTPKFTNPQQIVGYYSQKLSEARANIELVKSLKDNKLISSEKLPGLVQITGEGFPRSITKTGSKTTEGLFYAKPEVAQVLNNTFGTSTSSGTEKALAAGAALSSKVQDVALSGGVPYTPINAWSLAQYIYKEIPTAVGGNLNSFTRAPRAFYHSLVDSQQYFQKNLPIIQEMQRANIPVHTTLNLESLSKTKGVLGRLEDFVIDVKSTGLSKESAEKLYEGLDGVWSRAMNEATFKKFAPMLTIEFYKDVFKTAMSKTDDANEASRIAAQATKNFYGIVSSDALAKESEIGKSIKGIMLFAPRYRQSMLNFLVNDAKALSNPLALENRANIQFMIGKTVMYGIYNLINKQTTGKYMYENPQGYRDGILVDIGDGNTMKVPFDSSILTMPRALYATGQKAAEGDIPGALATGASKTTSTAISPFFDLFRNKDYFDREIIKDTDTPQEKATKSLFYILGKYNHPYVRELTDPRNIEDPAYQRLLRAAEVPVKFYSTKSVDAAPYFMNLSDSLKSLSAEERAVVDKVTNIKAEKKAKVDEEGVPLKGNSVFERMSNAADRLQYPNIVAAETAAQLKTYEQTGELPAPYYFLSPEQQRVVELLKTLFPGDQERGKIIAANENWIQNYYKKVDVYYAYMKSTGKFADVIEETGAPKMSPELKVKVNEYFSLPAGTGAKAKYLMDNPEVQQYFTDNHNWKNAQRMDLGLSLLPDYGGSSGKKPRGAVKSFGGAPKLPTFNLSSIKKVSTPKLKPLTAPKLDLSKIKI